MTVHGEFDNDAHVTPQSPAARCFVRIHSVMLKCISAQVIIIGLQVGVTYSRDCGMTCMTRVDFRETKQ